MHEINKEMFGAFISELRKEKGLTQKELADKLFVSDKAVSKWERGLSIPDVTLLIPLADILGVSVTELLEGQKLTKDSELKKSDVDAMIEKAISFSDNTPEKRKEIFRQNLFTFGSYTLISVVILAIVSLLCVHFNVRFAHETIWLLESLSFIFGIYFWLVLKNYLPTYYDDNKINMIAYKGFSMNLPGVNFNNSNWPHILHSLKVWSVFTMVTSPVICTLFNIIPGSYAVTLILQYLYCAGNLITMFALVYINAKKHG